MDEFVIPITILTCLWRHLQSIEKLSAILSLMEMKKISSFSSHMKIMKTSRKVEISHVVFYNPISIILSGKRIIMVDNQ